jgi:murein DD-endopeptidase MepM/ murein hydrolase activator NlpD
MIRILQRKAVGIRLALGCLALATSLWAASAAIAQMAGDDPGEGKAKAKGKGKSKGEGDLIGRQGIGPEVMKAITRMQGTKEASDRGMFETGLKATFKGANCHEVDEGWAINYAGVAGRGSGSLHGGIDIFAPRGTPVLAVAAGEVVAKYEPVTRQGNQIHLRHSPDDTGLPMWIYTQYTHLLELPELPIGARVRMGEVIGKNAATGIGAGNRRDAVHFAVIYTSSPKYYREDTMIVPQEGWWMDPHALYRPAPPYDSVAMKSLPASEKRIAIPYMLTDGTFVPADTKLIWPFACSTGWINRGIPQNRSLN